MPPKMQPWTCPGCKKSYFVLADLKPPAVCAFCRSAPPGGTPFQKVAAAVEIVEKPAPPEPPRAMVSRPPREIRGSGQQTVAKVNRRPVTSRRGIQIGLAIGIGLAAMLMGLMAFLFWPAKPRILSDNEVRMQAQAERAERLKSPRNAEFPDALKRPDEKFLVERAKIEKEWAERRQADMEREREMARAQAAIRDKLAADARAESQQRIAELQEKAAQARIDRQERVRIDRENAEKRREADNDARLQQIETRRAEDHWMIVAKLTNSRNNSDRRPLFRPHFAGWRIRYDFSAPAVIRVLDREGAQIGAELKLNRGKGIAMVPDAAPGTFLIDVEARGRWSLTIEE